METDMNGVEHIIQQALSGEFAILDDEARSMTVEEFSRKYGVNFRTWGTPHPGKYWCAVVDDIEYLWKRETGEYDGWNMAVSG